jgi:hypothetical protein
MFRLNKGNILMNTNDLIDLFESKFAVNSDESLALLLDLDLKQVGFWRSGQWPMPLSVKLGLSDHLGFNWVADSINRLINPVDHARLMALDTKRLAGRHATALP